MSLYRQGWHTAPEVRACSHEWAPRGPHGSMAVELHVCVRCRAPRCPLTQGSARCTNFWQHANINAPEHVMDDGTLIVEESLLKWTGPQQASGT